jgi:hypothetical protein
VAGSSSSGTTCHPARTQAHGVADPAPRERRTARHPWLRGALILACIFAGIRSDTGLRDIAGDITFDHVTVTVTDVLISLDLSALLIILRTVQIGEDVY